MPIDSKNYTSSLLHYFSSLRDPRVAGRCQHKLLDIVVITVCAYLSDVDTWEDIEFFANEKIEWFSKFLELPNLIPSHDTFSRVMSMIDGKEFERMFFDWVKSIKDLQKGQVIALDGKTVNGTCPGSWGGPNAKGPALALLNVWATRDELVIGQVLAKSTGTSELKSALEALDVIDVSGMVVTVDAASAGRDLTKKVVEKKGDYVIPCKRNQRGMSKKLEEIFANGGIARSTEQQIVSSKGRKETRNCCLIRVCDLPLDFQTEVKAVYEGVKVIAHLMYEREEKATGAIRITKDKDGGFEKNLITDPMKESGSDRFIVSSLDVAPVQIIDLVRSHWEIENSLHWRLDVVFGEDECRIRNKSLARNISLVRKMCMNLLEKHKTKKEPMKRMRKKCAWDDGFREKVLFS